MWVVWWACRPDPIAIRSSIPIIIINWQTHNQRLNEMGEICSNLGLFTPNPSIHISVRYPCVYPWICMRTDARISMRPYEFSDWAPRCNWAYRQTLAIQYMIMWMDIYHGIYLWLVCDGASVQMVNKIIKRAVAVFIFMWFHSMALSLDTYPAYPTYSMEIIVWQQVHHRIAMLPAIINH